MIVADSGPIIAFARIGRLGLLQRVVGELVLPEAVYDELVTRGGNRSGAADVARAAWIRTEAIQNREALVHFPPTLGAGECEAIILAEEQHATLFMDDWRAREVAVDRGIPTFGVLWVLAEAKRRGLVIEVRSIIEELLVIGYRLHRARVIGPFLQEMGESAPPNTQGP